MLTAHGQTATVGLGDGFADSEAQTGGILGFARAKVGLKNVRQVIWDDAFAAVLHFDDDALRML